jgi:hypothetical protein
VELSITPVLIRASPKAFTAHNNIHQLLPFPPDTWQVSIRYGSKKRRKRGRAFQKPKCPPECTRAPSLKCPVKHWKKVSSGRVIKWNFSWAKGAGILIFEMVACSYFFFPVDTHQVSCEK